MTLKIVADQNILALDHWQDKGVELILCDGRTLSAADVQDADAILVRSITRVDAALLSGSAVKFVATATSGTDHVDVDYLRQRGIEFASAAGANAAAVADYVMCCLAELELERGFSLTGKTVAVVGAGHVGSALLQRLKTTSAHCIACDPFQHNVPDVPYVSFAEAMGADVICLHTPLSREGDYPTFHMLNAGNLPLLAPNVTVINAGRGEVIDNAALLRHLQQKTAAGDENSQCFVLDVWEGEPNPDRELVSSVYLATPHIAGYSVEAKYAATTRIVSALCAHFELALPTFNVPDSAPVYHAGNIGGILATFSPRAVDRAFRQAYLSADDASAGASSFDNIRRSLMARRENQYIS